MSRMTFAQASALDLPASTDADLLKVWQAYASQISFHHADDSAKEWGLVPAIAEQARKVELVMRSRGMERPSASEYLMSDNDRIDWETGEWSQGWAWKKVLATKAAP